VEVAVQVDEPGDDKQSRGIDDAIAPLRKDRIGDFLDATIRDGEIFDRVDLVRRFPEM